MEQLNSLAGAAESGGGVNPLFFVLGALALIVVSTLGPLSRLHERRAAARQDTAAQDHTAPTDAAREGDGDGGAQRPRT